MWARHVARSVATSLLAFACSSPGPTKVPLLPPERRPLASAAPVVDAATPSSTPAEVVKPPDFPRTITLGSFAEGDRIADLTALAHDKGILLAWVTYFDGTGARPRMATGRSAPKISAPLGQSPKLGASVVVRAIDAQGEVLASPNVISVKADSIGGVALASAPPPREEIGLSWVGKDAGVGQVFVTRLSRAGEKQAQRMITRSKSGCSDVGIVAHKDGWVVSYVEQQGGHAAVYTAKVGRDLQRIGNERLVAKVEGEASEIRMVSRGDELLVAWSEVRHDPTLFGIWAARLAAGELSVRGDPTRISLSPQPIKGLRLASFGEGVVFGWIAESPSTQAGTLPKRTAVLMRLDPNARGTPEPVRVPVPVDASSLAFGCDRVCKVVIAGADGDSLALHGFAYDQMGALPPPAPLAAIPGISTEDASLVVVNDWIFFAEDNLRGGGRIRKAQLAWR